MKLTMAQDIQNHAIIFPENLAPSVFNIYQTLINDANNHKKLRARHENDLIRTSLVLFRHTLLPLPNSSGKHTAQKIFLH